MNLYYSKNKSKSNNFKLFALDSKTEKLDGGAITENIKKVQVEFKLNPNFTVKLKHRIVYQFGRLLMEENDKRKVVKYLPRLKAFIKIKYLHP